jgi:hypothetical protein
MAFFKERIEGALKVAFLELTKTMAEKNLRKLTTLAPDFPCIRASGL